MIWGNWRDEVRRKHNLIATFVCHVIMTDLTFAHVLQLATVRVQTTGQPEAHPRTCNQSVSLESSSSKEMMSGTSVLLANLYYPENGL